MRVLEVRREGGEQRIATFLTDQELADLKGIPAQAVIGIVGDGGDLRINSVFREFLHIVIAQYAPLDSDMKRVAAAQRDGRLVYIDARLPDSVEPVPDEDVLGWFQIREGVIVPGSYLPNPDHRIQGKHGLSAAIAAMRNAMVAQLRNNAAD